MSSALKHSEAKSAEARMSPRIAVSWAGTCWLEGLTLHGYARDVSEGGLFFQPDFGLGNRTLGPEECLKILLTNNPLRLELRHEEEEAPVNCQGQIRWTGYSQSWKCSGVGIVFASPRSVTIPNLEEIVALGTDIDFDDLEGESLDQGLGLAPTEPTNVVELLAKATSSE